MTRTRWLILLDAGFLLALMLFVIAGRDSVPFHGDESTFIAMSRDYDLLVYHGDLAQVQERDPVRLEYEQRLRVLNGAVNPLTIGLAWDIAGLSVDDLNEDWNWDPTEPSYAGDQWKTNVAAGALPDDRLLHIARTPSMLFAAFSVPLVYGIAWAVARRRIGNRFLARAAAWTASLIYVTNPAVLLNGRRAMQEGSMLFSSALVILVALHVIAVQRRPGTRGRTLALWYMLLGVAGGFAIACKHTGMVTVGAAVLALWLEPRLRRENAPRFTRDDRKRHNFSLAGLGLVTLLSAELLMPVWWDAGSIVVLVGLIILAFGSGAGLEGQRLWITRGVGGGLVVIAIALSATALYGTFTAPLKILSERSRLMSAQVDHIGWHSGLDRVTFLVEQAFIAPGEFYEDPVWADMDEPQRQIAAYTDSWLAGRGGGTVWGVLLIGLFGVGLASLAATWREAQALLVICWLLLIVMSLLLNPLPWQRYYIVLHAPLAVTGGLGAARIVLWRRARGIVWSSPPREIPAARK